jgi:hypothetical protein
MTRVHSDTLCGQEWFVPCRQSSRYLRVSRDTCKTVPLWCQIVSPSPWSACGSGVATQEQFDGPSREGRYDLTSHGIRCVMPFLIVIGQ